jgi:hemoglobin
MNPLPTIAVIANPHYARLGGEAAVVRLVEAFYAAMDARDDARGIRAMHAPDLSATKAVLVTYLCEWLGGPRRYTALRGAPRLRRVHSPFAVDAAAADAWLACMQQALDLTCSDAALRGELMAAFAKIARHLSSPPTDHHPRSH